MRLFDDLLHVLIFVVALVLIGVAVTDSNDAYPLLSSIDIVSSPESRAAAPAAERVALAVSTQPHS